MSEEAEQLSLQLYEHIMDIWFQVGMEPGHRSIPEMTELEAIAQYLIDEEELGGLDDIQLRMLGMYIYGFNHRNDPV